MWSFELPEECRHGSLGGLRDVFVDRNPGCTVSTRGPRENEGVEQGKGYWKLSVCGPKNNPIALDLAWSDALFLLKLTSTDREAQPRPDVPLSERQNPPNVSEIRAAAARANEQSRLNVEALREEQRRREAEADVPPGNRKARARSRRPREEAQPHPTRRTQSRKPTPQQEAQPQPRPKTPSRRPKTPSRRHTPQQEAQPHQGGRRRSQQEARSAPQGRTPADAPRTASVHAPRTASAD